MTTTFIDQFITFKLKEDTILYKGMSCDYNTSYNKASWLSFDIQDAQEYGNRIHSVKCKKELKLINLQSLFFQMDFTDRINKKYGGKDEKGLLALASVGLPSLKAQQNILTHQPGDCNTETTSTILAEYFNGKHRYSFQIGDTMIDIFLINELLDFYPQFDGYIVPNNWPSCFHSGFFHKEVCVFKPRNTLKYISSIVTNQKGGLKKVARRKTSKGGNLCGDPREDITIDQMNEITKDSFRAIGWTGPELYDEDGFIRRPTMDEIDRFRQYSLQPNVPDELVKMILQSRRQKGILTPGYDKNYYDTVKYIN
jgi:hypothetical protein